MRRLLLVLAVAAAPLVAPASPAGASGPTTGTISPRISASVAFPCQTGCGGSLSGTASLALSGVDAGQQPWTLAMSDSIVTGSISNLDANFACQSSVGSGHVNLTPTGTAGTAFGTYGAAPLPHSVVGASFQADFQYQRTSTVTRVTFSNASLVLTVQPSGGTGTFTAQVMRFGTGNAVTTFVPTGTGWALPCALGGTGPVTSVLMHGAGALVAT